MISTRNWIAMALVAAGLAGTQQAQAGSNREHGCLFTFLQGHVDTQPYTPPGLEPPMVSTFSTGATISTVSTARMGAVTMSEAPADADDFVVYKHMWQKNTMELGPLGRYQLGLIARRLRGVSFPVVIETCGDDKLDGARRDMIISLLGSLGFHDPSRVVVAYCEEHTNAAAGVNTGMTAVVGHQETHGPSSGLTCGGASVNQGSTGFCLDRGIRSSVTGRQDR